MSTDGLLTRIGRVIAAMAHATIDAAEQANAEALLEQCIREIDEAGAEVRTETGKVVAEKHRLDARRQELEREKAELDGKITIAVGNGREDLAEAGIGRQLDIEAQLAVLARSLQTAQEQIAQLNATLAAVSASRREASERLQQFKASQRAAKVSSDGSGPSSVTSDASAKVDRALSAAERVTGVPAGRLNVNPGLDQLEDMARDHAVKERLARFKAGQN